MSMRPSGGEDQGKERSASDDKSDSSVMDEEQVIIDVICKKARGILNKLTPDNFDKLVNKFMELQLEDKDERISSVISVVFEKAIDEPSFSATYAKLVYTVCKTPLVTSKKFRKQTLDQCQKEFQKCNTDEAEIKDVEQKLEEATDDETRDRLKLELEDKKFMVRRRSLGNVRFIGELYNLQMLSSKLMVECVHLLLYSPDEDNLECLCILLTTVGQKLDMQLKTLEDQSLRGDKPKPEMKWMDKILAKLKTLSENKNLSTRIRFAIFDVAELRKNAWQSLSNSAIAVIANAQQLQQAPVAQAHGGVVTAIPTQHQPQHTHPQQPVVQPQPQPMPRQEQTHEKKRKILTIVDPKTGRNVLEDPADSVKDDPNTSAKERNTRKAQFYRKIAHDSDDANNSNRDHRAVDGSGSRLPDSQQQKKGDWTTVSKASRFQSVKKTEPLGSGSGTPIFRPPSFGGGGQWGQKAQSGLPNGPSQQSSIPPREIPPRFQNLSNRLQNLSITSKLANPETFTADTRETVKNMFQEYLSCHKFDDTSYWIKSRFPGKKIDEFVDEISRQVTEMSKEVEQKCAGMLLRLLIRNKEISKETVIKVMAQGVMDDLLDVMIDVPKVTSYLAQFLVEIFYEESNLDWLVEVGDRLILFDGLMDCGESAWNELAVNSLNLLKLRLNEKAVRTSFRTTERRVLIPLDKLSWLQEDKTGTRFRSTDDK